MPAPTSAAAASAKTRTTTTGVATSPDGAWWTSKDLVIGSLGPDARAAAEADDRRSIRPRSAIARKAQVSPRGHGAESRCAASTRVRPAGGAAPRRGRRAASPIRGRTTTRRPARRRPSSARRRRARPGRRSARRGRGSRCHPARAGRCDACHRGPADLVVVGHDRETVDEPEPAHPAVRRPGPVGEGHRPGAGAREHGAAPPGPVHRLERRACRRGSSGPGPDRRRAGGRGRPWRCGRPAPGRAADPPSTTRATSTRAARPSAAARRSKARTPVAAARSGRPRAAAVGRTTIRIAGTADPSGPPPVVATGDPRRRPRRTGDPPPGARRRARATARAAATSSASRKGSSPARYSPPPWSPMAPLIVAGRAGAGTSRAGMRARSQAPRDDTSAPSGRRRAYDGRPMRVRTGDLVARIAAWTRRWDAILPLLAAELIVWLGFGALLPIMPLYFTEHGIDLVTLGVVVAAWPAARLIGEPIFGWLADRTRRVPLMVAGNVARRDLPVPAARVRRGRPVHDPAGRGRARDGDVRPGGPRLHHRRDPARTARRGVRAVRRGPDGRPAARAGDRRPGRDALRRRRVHLRVRGDQLLPRGGGDRDPRPRAAARHRAAPGHGAHGDGSPVRAPRRPRAAGDPAGGRRGRLDGPGDARCTGVAGQPLAGRGDPVHDREQLRVRDVRGRLVDLPPGPRRRSRAHRPDVRDVRPARSSSCRRSSGGGSIAAA